MHPYDTFARHIQHTPQRPRAESLWLGRRNRPGGHWQGQQEEEAEEEAKESDPVVEVPSDPIAEVAAASEGMARLFN